MTIKSGSAIWKGNLKEGRGTVSTESGVLHDQPYGFNTRFEDGVGTNPEELIGAAHAACFSMALSNILGQSDIVPDEISTTSKVTLDVEQLKVTKVLLEVKLKATGDEAALREAANKAERRLPDFQAAERRYLDGSDAAIFRLNHHFLGRRQSHLGVVAADAVDVPLQAGQVNGVAIAVLGDMAFVDVDEFLDIRLLAP